MIVTDVDAATFADVMAIHPAGVAVATCTRRGEADTDPDPLGLAITSLSAYTADPPSVLLSVAVSSRSHDALVAGETLGVHLLARDQAGVARVFASKHDDKFGGIEWAWDDGIPRLGGVLAFLRCRLDRCFAHRDHTIVVATVEGAWIDRDAHPLVYHDRRLEWHLVEKIEEPAA